MHDPDISRWSLIRDLFTFQVKLAMDAIRDLFLSPVSIICALADIFKGNSLSKSYFHRLMRLGSQTDMWLNLFGNHKQSTENNNGLESQPPKDAVNVDKLFNQVEALLKEQHDKGGITASAKATIDRYLNIIVENRNSKNIPPNNE
jgi:hypothetical protein